MRLDKKLKYKLKYFNVRSYHKTKHFHVMLDTLHQTDQYILHKIKAFLGFFLGFLNVK